MLDAIVWDNGKEIAVKDDSFVLDSVINKRFDKINQVPLGKIEKVVNEPKPFVFRGKNVQQHHVDYTRAMYHLYGDILHVPQLSFALDLPINNVNSILEYYVANKYFSPFEKLDKGKIHCVDDELLALWVEENKEDFSNVVEKAKNYKFTNTKTLWEKY